jgi:hypothetical protein
MSGTWSGTITTAYVLYMCACISLVCVCVCVCRLSLSGVVLRSLIYISQPACVAAHTITNMSTCTSYIYVCLCPQRAPRTNNEKNNFIILFLGAFEDSIRVRSHMCEDCAHMFERLCTVSRIYIQFTVFTCYSYICTHYSQIVLGACCPPRFLHFLRFLLFLNSLPTLPTIPTLASYASYASYSCCSSYSSYSSHSSTPPSRVRVRVRVGVRCGL